MNASPSLDSCESHIPLPSPTLLLDNFDLFLFRKSCGLSQRKFAIKYNLNLETIKRWEGGKFDPTFNKKFKRILGDYLVSGVQPGSILNSSELSRPNIKEIEVFSRIVAQIIAYQPSDSLPPWAGIDVSQYPKTCEGLEQFRRTQSTSSNSGKTATTQVPTPHRKSARRS